jgi:hypothetical protein
LGDTDQKSHHDDKNQEPVSLLRELSRPIILLGYCGFVCFLTGFLLNLFGFFISVSIDAYSQYLLLYPAFLSVGMIAAFFILKMKRVANRFPFFAHPFTCEITKEERAEWIDVCRKLKAMNASVVIPGHMRMGMLVTS